MLTRVAVRALGELGCYRLGDENDDGVLDYPEFVPLMREFAQQLGDVAVSDSRIRALFLRMVAEDDTGAISMDTFVSNVAGEPRVACATHSSQAEANVKKLLCLCLFYLRRLCQQPQEGSCRRRQGRRPPHVTSGAAGRATSQEGAGVSTHGVSGGG